VWYALPLSNFNFILGKVYGLLAAKAHTFIIS